jgi:hypothetical protein
MRISVNSISNGESRQSSSEAKLFLLGGYDLEMVTIRNLLIKHGFMLSSSPDFHQSGNRMFADFRLSWGASVTAYESLLSFPGSVFGIELSEPDGWKPPSNYHRIDHHNESANNPSSIEQVAAILGHELSPYERIIVANDTGYIPALEALKLTKDEIAEIRRRDREAQGVTAKDEQLAEDSITKNLVREKDIAIIKSGTDRFSAITDLMYGKASRMIVYNEKKVTFYGFDIHVLNHKYRDMIREGKAYSGGGPTGFFGVSERALPAGKLLEMVHEIIHSKI